MKNCRAGKERRSHGNRTNNANKLRHFFYIDTFDYHTKTRVSVDNFCIWLITGLPATKVLTNQVMT